MSIDQVLLTCGCTASSILTHSGGKKLDPPVPTCVHGTTEVVKQKPDLTGRKAHCTYGGKEKDSSWGLAFFEYQGPGSKADTDTCKHCGYYQVAHTPEVQKRNPKAGCGNFEPTGGKEFDRYYCGCRGWD